MPEDFDKQEVPLSRLKIKKDVLVGGIVRNGEFICPSGNTCLQSGDKVIVVTTIKQIGGMAEIFRRKVIKTESK